MPKHIGQVMSQADFATGVKLEKFTAARFFKGDTHPLKVIHKLLGQYHALAKPKLDARHAVLTDIVAKCVSYAGAKPASKHLGTKVVTVRTLEVQAANVVLLETARAAALASNMKAATPNAKVGGENKFEPLNKEGDAMRGDLLMAFAKEHFQADLTWDDDKDFYIMKKILKVVRNQYADKLTLVYLDAEKRAKHVLNFDDNPGLGQVVDGDQETVTTTTAPGAQYPSWWMFAASPRGEVFAVDEKTYHTDEKLFNHSSFLAGAPALCAGMIRVVNGRLTEIANLSGHYKPRIEHLLQVCEAILDSGYDPTGDGYVIVADFQDLYQQPQSSGHFRIPINDFVNTQAKVKGILDFQVTDAGAGRFPYTDLKAAKKRGCADMT